MYLRVTDIMERGFSLGLGVLCLPESVSPLQVYIQFLARGFVSQWVLWTEHSYWIALGM